TLTEAGFAVQRRERRQPNQPQELRCLAFPAVKIAGGGFVVGVEARPGILIVEPWGLGTKAGRRTGSGSIVAARGLAHNGTNSPRRASRSNSLSFAVMRWSGTPSGA